MAIDENNVDAAVFSKSDLTFNGEGTLTINAAAGHGAVSKDDLALTSGTYIITAASHGLSGKDSVRIAYGDYTITSGKDGIHVENADDTSLGFLYVAGGTFDITAGGDGMNAGVYLQVDGGDFTIATGDGSESVTMSTDTLGTPFDVSPQAQETTASEDEDTTSQKGIKADGVITIQDGSFTADTADDSVHAGGDITIDDGTFDVTSVDDGVNAAGGADSSGFGGRFGPQEQYKRSVQHEKTIRSELKRCSDEIASVDVSMQTLRDLVLDDRW